MEYICIILCILLIGISLLIAWINRTYSYRIETETKENGNVKYYPMRKWFIFWEYFYDSVGYQSYKIRIEDTFEKALKHIEEHKLFLERKKKDRVISRTFKRVY